MPDEHHAFFTPNTKYRAPMFVATSLRYTYVFTLYVHCVRVCLTVQIFFEQAFTTRPILNSNFGVWCDVIL